MANKYYAVKTVDGRKVNKIFEDWEDCRIYIKGHRTEFKSFKLLGDAEEYLEEESEIKVFDPKVRFKKTIVCFIDGSYSVSDDKISYGVVMMLNNTCIEMVTKVFEKNTGERNILGELEGALAAVRIAKNKYKANKVVIVHGYRPVQSYITGEWKPKSDSAREYKKKMENLMKKIHVKFRWYQEQEENCIGNELADLLAKECLGIKFSTLKLRKMLGENNLIIENNVLPKCIRLGIEQVELDKEEIIREYLKEQDENSDEH